MSIRLLLTELVSAAFADAGYSGEYGQVTVSNRPDLCQFQCNGAMAAAKQYRKAPIMIAGDVVRRLEADGRFASVTAAAPGFINLTLEDAFLAEQVRAMAADPRLLLPTLKKETVVVDFGGPNVAKPLHVGHLRPAILGDSMCRLARFLGKDVIGDVHLGDWGLPMGLVIAEIKRMYPDLVYFDPSYTGDYPDGAPVTVDELNDIYPRASARSKTDPQFAAEAGRITVELQRKQPGYYALWERIRAVSVADIRSIYDILGVHFDVWYGERDADPYIPRVLDILKDKGLLYESQGAMVVDVATEADREPMPPMILVKSDGGTNYEVTDLGTLLQRKEDWNPASVLYFVDNRQAFHFKQVFRCAALGGITGDTVCEHCENGTINGPDGKPFKTRDGGVMRLMDMITMVSDSAYEKVKDSDALDDAEKRSVAQAVGVAAIKIGDMLNHRSKDYVFDMERFLSSEGKTGPYLQYTTVRIGSVLEKAAQRGEAPGELMPPASDTERSLMLSLLSVSDALVRAYQEKAPNVICETLFDVAGLFNRFYFENKILTCPDSAQRASWLALLQTTYRMQNTLLGLLGITVPAHM